MLKHPKVKGRTTTQESFLEEKRKEISLDGHQRHWCAVGHIKETTAATTKQMESIEEWESVDDPIDTMTQSLTLPSFFVVYVYVTQCKQYTQLGKLIRSSPSSTMKIVAVREFCLFLLVSFSLVLSCFFPSFLLPAFVERKEGRRQQYASYQFLYLNTIGTAGLTSCSSSSSSTHSVLFIIV